VWESAPPWFPRECWCGAAPRGQSAREGTTRRPPATWLVWRPLLGAGGAGRRATARQASRQASLAWQGGVPPLGRGRGRGGRCSFAYRNVCLEAAESAHRTVTLATGSLGRVAYQVPLQFHGCANCQICHHPFSSSSLGHCSSQWTHPSRS